LILNTIYSAVICEAHKVHLGEFGVYDVNVGQDCNVSNVVGPVNETLALLYCTLILLALGLAYCIAKWAVTQRYTVKFEKLYKIAKRQIGYEVTYFKITIFFNLTLTNRARFTERTEELRQ
jgi:branched-subunit amino acid permease